jgi:hypothetical protein
MRRSVSVRSRTLSVPREGRHGPVHVAHGVNHNRLPTIRSLMHEVIHGNLDGIRSALTTVLNDPETVLHGLDLAARLNRELGPPRLVLGEEATEGGGLTVALKQYVVSSVVTAAAASSASTRAPDPAIPALPVRADSASEDDQPLTVSSSSSSPATPELEDEPTPATDTVRITVKHFGGSRAPLMPPDAIALPVLEPRVWQQEVLAAWSRGVKRFAIVVHRRSGKTALLLALLSMAMVQRVGTYYYVTPTFVGGRRIVWDALDHAGRPMLDASPRPSSPRGTRSRCRSRSRTGACFRSSARTKPIGSAGPTRSGAPLTSTC